MISSDTLYNSSELNGAALSYLGDAVIELQVRQRLVASGINCPGRLNDLARLFVQAKAQSEAAGRIMPDLSGEETAVFKRGRNQNRMNIPPGATVSQYRRASGLEALFGALYLDGHHDRLKELFDAAYAPVLDEIDISKYI